MLGKGNRRLFLVAIALLAMLSLFSQTSMSQENIVLIDTSDYLPLPDGLNINLSIAASKGYVSEVYRLVGMGADYNSVNELGVSPVMYAVANNKQYALKALLTYDPDLDTYTPRGESALHLATKYNYLEIAELLIRKKANIDIKDQFSCTPLHYAAAYNYLYICDLLLYYGASINVKSVDGTSPLMAAVWAGNAEIADLLIQEGADITLADDKGFTALLIAAQNGDTLISRLLLNANANLSDKNSYGYDFASLGARAGDEEFMRFVFEDTDWKEKHDLEAIDPLTVARRYGRSNLLKILNENRLEQDKSIRFDNVQLSLNTKFGLHDIYTGMQVSFVEPLYKVRLNTGFEYKPWSTRVLATEDEIIYYQYVDKRYVFSAGLGKELIITDNYFKGKTSLLINLNIGYMISSQYKGTYLKPDNKFRIMPGIFLEKTISNFSFSAGYEYMNTDLYKAGPGWIKLSASYLLQSNKTSSPLKNIAWY